MKRCCRCGELKPESEFNKRTRSSDGLEYSCRECTKEYQREWRRKNPEKVTEHNQRYYYGHHEQCKAAARESYQNHKEERKANSRRWRAENADVVRSYNRRWKAVHKVERCMKQLDAMRCTS